MVQAGPCYAGSLGYLLIGMAGIGDQHGQLPAWPEFRVGDRQTLGLEICPGLQDNLCMGWQDDVEPIGGIAKAAGVYSSMGTPALWMLAGVLPPTRMGLAFIWRGHISVGASAICGCPSQWACSRSSWQQAARQLVSSLRLGSILHQPAGPGMVALVVALLDLLQVVGTGPLPQGRNWLAPALVDGR